MSPMQKTQREKEGMQTMTLLEIAEEYRLQEERIRCRILELRRELKRCPRQQRLSLTRRINDLTALRRETRELATLLEHYYERGYYKSGKYSL